jgi:hypothetical protein
MERVIEPNLPKWEGKRSFADQLDYRRQRLAKDMASTITIEILTGEKQNE